MWIEMTGTYVGPSGQYFRGHRYDLAPDIVATLPDDSYRQCRPPWEDNADTKIQRQTQTARLEQKLGRITAEIRDINSRAEQLTQQAQATEQTAEQAKKQWYALREAVDAKRQAAKKAAEKAVELEESIGRKQKEKTKARARAEAAIAREKAEKAQAELKETRQAEFDADYTWRQAHINAHRKYLQARDMEEQAKLKKLQLDKAQGRLPKEVDEKMSETPKDKQTIPPNTK